ncbi:MAG: hypothetical protein ACRENN_03640 [Candidatus Eiseniibacteriota bacterium]
MDPAIVIPTIDLWTQRADAGLIVNEPPWDSLLAGRSPDSLIRNNQLALANYYRAKGLRLIVSIDATNGLNRTSDSDLLVAAGRSLTEPAIQQLYRSYVTAMDTLLHPDYLGVASETNLIRAAAPSALYGAVVAAANGAALDVHAVDPGAKLFTTVQVEVAWGRLPPTTPYVGVAQDLADFGFINVLGLSSYPYLGGFTDPDSLPLDYYSRLAGSGPLPVMVVEGGWSSEAVANPSSPDMQRRYIVREAELLDQANAIGWFQITFTDIDTASFGLPPGSILPLFASLGLVDVNLAPKPALSAWDAIFARPFR